MKDLISEEEGKRILADSSKLIQEATHNYNPESLRQTFHRENKRLEDLKKRTANHIDGEYTVTEAPEPIILDFVNAKRVFWDKCYKPRIKKDPVITQNNGRVLNNILHWMIQEPGAYNLNKGLFIFGDFGRGKTDLLYALKLFSYKMSKRFDNVVAWPHIQEYKFMIKKAKEDKSVKGLYQGKGVSIIDDLGFMGESQINIFGNKSDLVMEIIYSRHKSWKNNNNQISIFTSNLTIDTITNLHGKGVSGRLKEMCNLIFWDGIDFRTQ